MIKRILKLLLEWYLIQQLKESITESIPSWAEVIASFFELLIQHQLKSALARIGCTKLPQYATKPMFRFLSTIMLGAGLLAWFVPLYIIFANALISEWDVVAISAQSESLSLATRMGSFFVAPALIAKLRCPNWKNGLILCGAQAAKKILISTTANSFH